MSTIISIHSFRGGTGKSNTSANIAAALAEQGQRVAVIDTDIQSPGIHILFGLAGDDITTSLNDFLWHGRAIKEVAQDVTAGLPVPIKGRIFLVPSSTQPGEISRVLREGYDAQRMAEGFRRLMTDLQLDTLIIDTHPGLNGETLLSLVISDVLLIVMRPDQQDYEGTGITVQVARELQVPRILLLVNKVPPDYDSAEIRTKVENAYGCTVAGVLPHSNQMMSLASAGIFALKFPDHELSSLYRQVASQLVSSTAE